VELGRGGLAPAVVQRAYNNLAEEMVALGRIREAARLYAEARAEVERFGIVAGIRWITPQQAWAAYMLGEWERVDELLGQYLKLLEDSQGHYLEGMMLVMQASMARARGDGAAARSYAGRALAHSREVKDPQALGPALATLARVLVEQGFPDEAGALVDELLELKDESGAALYFSFLIDLGWLVHDLGRADEPLASRRAPLWYEVEDAVTRGDLVGAADLLAATDLRTEEAYARLRAAELLASQGRHAEAQAHLEPALAFYRSVGADAYVSRGETLLPASA
jgi:tetratricopeptide (TPR) repeat protein